MSHPRLTLLDAEIDARTAEVRTQAPDWPCQAGCATCCRHLSAPHLLSPPEWARLEAGLRALPPAEAAEIEAGLDAMAEHPLDTPLVCPVLDRETDRCRLYAHRPLACRTHGYYATRRGGYWCDDIDARVEAGGAADVVFGRYEALERTAQRHLGEPETWAERRAARGPRVVADEEA